MALPMCSFLLDYNMSQQILCGTDYLWSQKMGIKNAFSGTRKKNNKKPLFQRSKQLTMNAFLTFVLFEFCANLKSLHQDHLQSSHCYVRHLDEFVCGSGKKKRNREGDRISTIRNKFFFRISKRHLKFLCTFVRVRVI